jgi:hypothetical protein
MGGFAKKFSLFSLSLFFTGGKMGLIFLGWSFHGARHTLLYFLRYFLSCQPSTAPLFVFSFFIPLRRPLHYTHPPHINRIGMKVKKELQTKETAVVVFYFSLWFSSSPSLFSGQDRPRIERSVPNTIFEIDFWDIDKTEWGVFFSRSIDVHVMDGKGYMNTIFTSS